MAIPCKECLVLAICKAKQKIDCDILLEWYLEGGGHNQPFDCTHLRIVETLPQISSLKFNGVYSFPILSNQPRPKYCLKEAVVKLNSKLYSLSNIELI